VGLSLWVGGGGEDQLGRLRAGAERADGDVHHAQREVAVAAARQWQRRQRKRGISMMWARLRHGTREGAVGDVKNLWALGEERMGGEWTLKRTRQSIANGIDVQDGDLQQRKLRV
jgi:hypothetical protein